MKAGSRREYYNYWAISKLVTIFLAHEYKLVCSITSVTSSAIVGTHG